MACTGRELYEIRERRGQYNKFDFLTVGSMGHCSSITLGILVHVVINNEAHESVGGMPTVAGTMNIPQIALGCGYESAVSARTPEELKEALQQAKKAAVLSLIEVKCAVGARADLGRPKTSPRENRDSFMEYLRD